jgi:competence protein ComEC
VNSSINKFSAKTPLLQLLTPLIIGIVVQWYFPNAIEFHFKLIVIGFLLVGFVFFLSYSARFIYGFIGTIGAYVLFIGSGILLCYKKDVRNNNDWFGIFSNEKHFYKVQLLEQAKAGPKTIRAKAAVMQMWINGNWVNTSGNCLLYFLKKDSSQFKNGDIPYPNNGDDIIINAKAFEILNDSSNSSFNQQRYWLAEKTTHRFFLHYYNWKSIDGSKANTFILDSIRNKVLSALKTSIKNKEALGLAEALLIGYRNDLDKELIKDYTNTGVIHIIAISGLHIGLIYSILLLILSPLERFKSTRWITIPATLLVVWIFSLLAGASPSVLRSAVLFTCIGLGKMINRKSLSINTMAFSAVLLLLYNPFWLWDLGFQLSYSAVLSILLFHKPIYNAIEFSKKWVDYLWDSISLTLSAQILTTPISIYWFHQFPIYFLISNLIAVPISGVVLILELLICVLYKWNWAVQQLGKIATLFILTLNKIIDHIGRMPGAVIQGINIRFVQVVLIYGLIGAISYGLKQKTRVSMLYFLILLIFTIGSFVSSPP